jgi:hypothetical protein
LSIALLGSCEDGPTTSAPTAAVGEAPPDPRAAEVADRLAQMERETAEAEQRAARAKEEAAFYECKASVERVTATARAEQATCMNAIAQQARCIATVERQKGDASLVGALFGIVLAVGSGGTMTPWALGGAFAGRTAGEMNAKECPAPECTEDFTSLHQQLVEKEGWQRLPQCGGWLGLDVETPSLTLIGGAVIQEPGGMAAAGLAKGDFIAFVNDERTKTAAECADALRVAFLAFDTTRRQEAKIKFVRGEMMYQARLTVQERYDGSLLNGASASHRYGARVLSVEPDGAANGTLRAGDTVFAVDGVTSMEHLRDLLRYRRSGESLNLKVRRDGVPELQTHLALLPRGDRDGI